MTKAIEQAIGIIKEFEGYWEELPDGSARSYPDPKVGWELPTIGYGTTRYPDGSNVKKWDIITREKAEECLLHEVKVKCQEALSRIPRWNQMNENQQAAIYSFAYNLGPYFYGRKGFVSIMNLCDTPSLWGDPDYVESVFIKYRNPGSDVEKGLKKRRIAEAKLFCAPVGG